MRNVQRRIVPAPAANVGRLIDELADPAVSVWPSPAWPPLVLDRGLQVGSRGGHGPIRYAVTAHEPGRSLTLAFAPGSGLDGWHELAVSPQEGGRSLLVHTISASTHGRMRWAWPLMVRWLHEALVQDLFDNAERRVTGTLAGRRARWSPWVRAIRRLAS
jgi:hypothetical protein